MQVVNDQRNLKIYSPECCSIRSSRTLPRMNREDRALALKIRQSRISDTILIFNGDQLALQIIGLRLSTGRWFILVYRIGRDCIFLLPLDPTWNLNSPPRYPTLRGVLAHTLYSFIKLKGTLMASPSYSNSSKLSLLAYCMREGVNNH